MQATMYRSVNTAYKIFKLLGKVKTTYVQYVQLMAWLIEDQACD